VTIPELTWDNTIIGNAKNALTGTYHAIRAKHLPRTLAEFGYRLRPRFKLDEMIPPLGYAAVRTPPMPSRLLRPADGHR
jgi:hypothetical protein